MNYQKVQLTPVTKIAYKLEAEINEIKSKLEQIKAKYENIQVAYTNQNTKKEVKAKQSNFHPQYCEVEDKLQEVINELSLWVAIKA